MSSYIISLFRNNGWNLCQKKGVSDNFYFKCRIYFHFMIIRYFSNVLCTFYIYFLYTLSFVKQMIVAEYSVCWLAVARRRYFILYLSRTKIVFRRASLSTLLLKEITWQLLSNDKLSVSTYKLFKIKGISWLRYQRITVEKSDLITQQFID